MAYENFSAVEQTIKLSKLGTIADEADKEWRDTLKRIAALKAQNAELVEALREIAYGPMGKSAAVKRIARDALDKYGVLK